MDGCSEETAVVVVVMVGGVGVRDGTLSDTPARPPALPYDLPVDDAVDLVAQLLRDLRLLGLAQL